MLSVSGLNNSDLERFICKLTEETEGKDPPKTPRRLLNKDEGREMCRDGMAICFRTRPIRNQLNPSRRLIFCRLRKRSISAISLRIAARPSNNSSR